MSLITSKPRLTRIPETKSKGQFLTTEMTSQRWPNNIDASRDSLRRWTKDYFLLLLPLLLYNIYKDSSHPVTRLDSVETKRKTLGRKVAGSNPARAVEYLTI